MNAFATSEILKKLTLTSIILNYNISFFYTSQFNITPIFDALAFKFKIVKPSGIIYFKTLYTWHKSNKNTFFWGELIPYEFGQSIELGEYSIAVAAVVSSTYSVQDNDYGEYCKIVLNNDGLVI